MQCVLAARLRTLKAVTRHVMSQLITAAIAQELQRDALLTMEQLNTCITVLAFHAAHRPGDTPRVREVFGQLLEVVHQVETDMAVFDLP